MGNAPEEEPLPSAPVGSQPKTPLEKNLVPDEAETPNDPGAPEDDDDDSDGY